jgi:GNAT superfamily N-acetyltransferase
MLEIHSALGDPQPYLEVEGFSLSREQLDRAKPDDLLLACEGGRVRARCGLWFSQTPPYPGHRLGLVGHYFADSMEAGRAVLRAACSRLAEENRTLAVGPMDGNTWQRYRLITERGSEPVFFLEPDNPDDWPGHFLAEAFAPLARYHSSLTTRLQERDPRREGALERLAERGISLRKLDVGHFDDELRRIHELSLLSFAGNFLYTPISESDFLSQYAPIRPFVRPDLVLLAEQEGRLVGFLFAVEDVLQARRGQPIDTAIIKTMAVHPELGGLGLGGYLMDRAHQEMHECGCRRAIHALMHESNFSGRISRHTAQVIRRYTLFARPLEVP